MYSAVLHADESWDKKVFEKAYMKILRLAAACDDYVSDHIPADVTSFQQAMRMMPKWDDPLTSYIFHRDDPDILPENRDQVLLQRVLEKEAGYLHAPVILQHYVVSKRKKSRMSPEILDIAKYIREVFKHEQLFNHIFLDKGMPSTDFLSMILDHDSVIRKVDFEFIDAAFLREHGPVLLSEFPICDDFAADDGRLVHDLAECDDPAPGAPRPPPVACANRRNFTLYTDEATGRCVRYHAMLIIGARTEGASRRFLVQNWWRRHQFLELSIEYLEALRGPGPSAYAVVTPQRAGVPAGFARPAAPYAEPGSLDAREKWAWEA
jgi:hypothetical protein